MMMALDFNPRILCTRSRRQVLSQVRDENGKPVAGQSVVAIIDGEVDFEPCGDPWVFRTLRDKQSFIGDLRRLVEAHPKYPDKFDDGAREALTRQAQELLDRYTREGRVLPAD